LDEVLADWLAVIRIDSVMYCMRIWDWRGPVKHGIECGDLVHAHGRHLKHGGDIIHDAETCPSLILSLAEVKERDDSSLFVLWRIVRDDLLSAFEVLRCEFERNLTQT